MYNGIYLQPLMLVVAVIAAITQRMFDTHEHDRRRMRFVSAAYVGIWLLLIGFSMYFSLRWEYFLDLANGINEVHYTLHLSR